MTSTTLLQSAPEKVQGGEQQEWEHPKELPDDVVTSNVLNEPEVPVPTPELWPITKKELVCLMFEQIQTTNRLANDLAEANVREKSMQRMYDALV